MNIFSTLGTTASVGSAIYAYDRENEEFNKKRLKKVGTTSLITGATTVVGQVTDKMTMDKIHREYASAYVDSMSDEELERALIALGDLENQENVNDTTKTI